MGDSRITRTSAGVLIPVYRDDEGGLRLILIRRSEQGIHGGQLAFPGGKHDRGDTTMVATALREAYEEIGLAPEGVTVLASLPCVDTMTSNFRLFPFLASIVPPITWMPEVEEVSEVIDTSLTDLTRADRHGEEIMMFPQWPRPYRVPFYMVGKHLLWGATYRILRPLLPRILAGEWDI